MKTGYSFYYMSGICFKIIQEEVGKGGATDDTKWSWVDTQEGLWHKEPCFIHLSIFEIFHDNELNEYVFRKESQYFTTNLLFFKTTWELTKQTGRGAWPAKLMVIAVKGDFCFPFVVLGREEYLII